MTKSKKSFMLSLVLIFGLLIAIVFAIELSGKSKDFNIVGEYALSLLDKSKETEKAIFYIDQCTKHSIQQAIYEIAQNGGVSEIENIGTDESFADYKCGKFKDSYMWLEVKKNQDNYNLNECFDENSVKDYLLYLFDQNLNQCLDSAPKELPVDNYNYNIKDNTEIVGTAKEPITFNILKYDKEAELPSLKPRQYKIDSEGKIVAEEKTETKTPATGKLIPENKIKSFVDFSGVTSATMGKETVDITGLCPKGKRCSLTNEAFQLLVQSQKKAKEKKITLEVIDAYRTKQQQTDIWEGKTASRWAQRIPDETKRRAKVCYPYGDDVEQRCPHLSGNAVDVVFKDKTTKTMTGADWQQLRSIMTSAGWVGYGAVTDLKKGELWHFECCGTQRVERAEQAGVTAIV